jgi:general secretion pathway protein G
MGHRSAWLAIGIAVLVLAGCGRDGAGPGEKPDLSTPSSAVRAFLEIQRGLGPEHTARFYTRKAREEAAKEENADAFEIVGETIEGDTATVKVRTRKAPFDMEMEMVYVLKKEEEEWRIARAGVPPMMIDFEDLAGTAKDIKEAKFTESIVDPPGGRKEKSGEIEEKLERDTFRVDAPIVLNDKEGARVARARILLLTRAMETYRLDVGAYPSPEDGLKALLRKPEAVAGDRWKGPYIEVEEVDPWTRRYQVRWKDGGFEIFSFGPDGVESEDDIRSD